MGCGPCTNFTRSIISFQYKMPHLFRPKRCIKSRGSQWKASWYFSLLCYSPLFFSCVCRTDVCWENEHCEESDLNFFLALFAHYFFFFYIFITAAYSICIQINSFKLFIDIQFPPNLNFT